MYKNTVQTGTFENDAGDRVILNYVTETSITYESAGYKLIEDSAAVTKASLDSAGVDPDSDADADAAALMPADEDIRSKDDQDVRADPSAVAYPAGQLPRTAVAGGHDVEPISDKTMQDSQPKGEGGTAPLTQAYDTPPTEDRNPAPERREAEREANAAANIVDPRGVHEKSADNVDAEGNPVQESSGGPVADKPIGAVDTPADLKAASVVEKSQGGNASATSQGTERPAVRTRSGN